MVIQPTVPHPVLDWKKMITYRYPADAIVDDVDCPDRDGGRRQNLGYSFLIPPALLTRFRATRFISISPKRGQRCGSQCQGTRA
jgi:hypothetical protein